MGQGEGLQARLLLRGWRLRGAQAAGLGEPRAWPPSPFLTAAASVSALASEAWTQHPLGWTRASGTLDPGAPDMVPSNQQILIDHL